MEVTGDAGALQLYTADGPLPSVSYERRKRFGGADEQGGGAKISLSE